MNKKEDEYLILGLDVSTKCIGISLVDNRGMLLELTHISPNIKPKPEDKTEELFKKADLFYDFIQKYKKMKIKYVVIEEPLLRSNNVNTVATLMKFNGIVSKMIFDMLGIVPTYISTYESRKNGFPELMQPNAKGQAVLFGGLPKDVDKKEVVWKLVSKKYPDIKWLKDKKGELKKENFDMADSLTVVLAFAHINDIFV